MASADPQVTSDSDGEIDLETCQWRNNWRDSYSAAEGTGGWKKEIQTKSRTTEMYKRMKKEMDRELAAKLDEQAAKITPGWRNWWKNSKLHWMCQIRLR